MAFLLVVLVLLFLYFQFSRTRMKINTKISCKLQLTAIVIELIITRIHTFLQKFNFILHLILDNFEINQNQQQATERK